MMFLMKFRFSGKNNDNNYNDFHQNNNPDGPSQSEGSNSEVGRDNNNNK